MNRRSGSNAARALKNDWRRWTSVVNLIARSRSTRLPITTQEFQALYQRLTTACSERAGSGDDAGRDLHEKMAATVRPWLSPQALARADGDILGDLLQRCRWIEREMGVRAGARAILRRAAPLFLIPAATILLVIAWTVRGPWLPLVEALRVKWAVLWLSLKRSSELEKLSVLGIILILVSIYSVSRTSRS